MAKRTFWLLALISILSTACRPDGATSQPGKDSKLRIPQPFPDQARLDAIKAAPVPAATTPAKIAMVDAWTMRGPLPTTIGATLAKTAEAVALAQILGSDRPVTDQMSCFAREVAAFGLVHPEEPPPELVTWLGARCGVGHAGPNLLLARQRTAGSPLFDVARDRDAVLEAVGSVTGPADFGIAVVEDGKSASVVIAYVRRTTTLQNVSMVPQDGRVVIAGESHAPVGWVRGSVTLGRDGVGSCAPVASKRSGLQAFALSCPVDARDASANIEVVIAPVGALVGDVEVSLWTSPDGSLGDTWTALDVAIPVAQGEVDPLAWLTAINVVRERNGLAPWTLARAQSDEVAALAPHLFDGPDPRTRDEVALGMLAGWKVEGTIRNADLAYLLVPRGVPLGRSLGSAMARPSFRALVMSNSRDMGALALRKVDDLSWDRLVLVGYGLFEPRDYRVEEERFLDQLDADRGSRGLPPVERVGGPRDRKMLDETATRVRNGESEPSEEVEFLLDHFAEATGQSVRGVVFTTLTLDGFRPPFDGPLATATGVIAIVKIADWRPAGAAWGQHIIYVVYAVPGER